MTQKTLMEIITPHKKAAQRLTILKMLHEKPCNCMQFMAKGISQYNARIFELRAEGYNIKYCTRWKRFMLKNEEE